MTTPEPARFQPSEILRRFKTLVPHLRTDTLKRVVDVVQAIITGQTVNLSALCAHLPGTSSHDAKKRRAERALRDEQLTEEVFLSLLLPLLPAGKLLLSLDRTTWERGDAPLNLLVLGVILNGYTLPLVWTALPHDGNSSTDHRLDLVKRLLKVLPARRWKGLVADREFIGGAWFTFLREQGIKRALRIRKNAVVDGLRIDEWFCDVQEGEAQCLFEKAEVYGERMQVVATRSPTGDLVVIATDFRVQDTLALYRKRWSIECTFASLKTRGPQDSLGGLRVMVEQATQQQIRRQGLQVTWFQGGRWKMFEIEGHDHLSLRGDRRCQHMTVVRVRQVETENQVFVSVEERVRHGLIHEAPSAGQPLRSQVGAVRQQVPGPFIVNLNGLPCRYQSADSQVHQQVANQ